jgi:hypothetical protein
VIGVIWAIESLLVDLIPAPANNAGLSEFHEFPVVFLCMVDVIVWAFQPHAPAFL